jgi:hypothetical protein
VLVDLTVVHTDTEARQPGGGLLARLAFLHFACELLPALFSLALTIFTISVARRLALLSLLRLVHPALFTHGMALGLGSHRSPSRLPPYLKLARCTTPSRGWQVIWYKRSVGLT